VKTQSSPEKTNQLCYNLKYDQSLPQVPTQSSQIPHNFLSSKGDRIIICYNVCLLYKAAKTLRISWVIAVSLVGALCVVSKFNWRGDLGWAPKEPQDEVSHQEDQVLKTLKCQNVIVIRQPPGKVGWTHNLVTKSLGQWGLTSFQLNRWKLWE
jgi:hypothetical protein